MHYASPTYLLNFPQLMLHHLRFLLPSRVKFLSVLRVIFENRYFANSYRAYDEHFRKTNYKIREHDKLSRCKYRASRKDFEHTALDFVHFDCARQVQTDETVNLADDFRNIFRATSVWVCESIVKTYAIIVEAHNAYVKICAALIGANVNYVKSHATHVKTDASENSFRVNVKAAGAIADKFRVNVAI